MMKRFIPFVCCVYVVAFAARPGENGADKGYLADRAALEEVQRAAFGYMWEDAEPNSGMAYEANFDWPVRPVAVGGTGFGVAAMVVAAERGWITREQAVARILRITRFLLNETERERLHGAFPHWLDGATGKSVVFQNNDSGADIVETSLLVQGLLIARAYFNGPGVEATLRQNVTAIWEEIDWDWFTDGEENGLQWHWNPEKGFSGLKILGYNECLITYVLAMASPTRPISRQAYNYWTSGPNYRTRNVYGYQVEATSETGGPLFLAHYSFVGLDPRRMADEFVPGGYYLRGVRQALANRGYCLYNAPPANRYAENFWGLTACQMPNGGYAVNEPGNDGGAVAPTATLSSMPYTPHYSMQVLNSLRGGLRGRIWGEYGPFDAISLRDDWASDRYLAIDQLPIVCMIENYRSGLLWKLFMADADVRRGLERAGIAAPRLAQGFSESVVALQNDGVRYVELAHDLRRHPETGRYAIPYWCDEAGQAVFAVVDAGGRSVFEAEAAAAKGRNLLLFDHSPDPEEKGLVLIMRAPDEREYRLPIRLN